MTTSPDAAAWDALLTSDLADEVKGRWNQTKRTLDDQASEILKQICNAADGAPLPPDAVNRAARLVVAIRATPWLI